MLARVAPPPDAILVGGQALAFWVEFYGARDAEIAARRPVTSADVDFVGPPEAARACAARLGGRLQFAQMDHATANYAVVHFVDRDGHERIVDFLERVCGVKPKDLERTAMRVAPLDPSLKATGLQLTVMHPVVCMESRISNAVEYEKYRGKHGLLQARMSILCARAFLRDLLDQGLVDAVMKLNERVFRFARERTGREAHARWQLDAFDAVVVDERLPAAFRTRRYPQMQREVEKAYAKAGRVGGRPKK